MDYIFTIDDFVPASDQITQSVIENLKKPKFYTIQDDNIVNYIHQYCIHLMKFSKDKCESKEIAYAIDLNTLEFIGAEFGNSHSVDIGALIDKIKDDACIFMVAHNHPSDKTFSPRDLITFFSVPNMVILMVLGNKGSMYIIEKTNKTLIDNNYTKIKQALIKYRKSQQCFDVTINELKQYGIMYTTL